jgi:uncharacterized protein YndB with AHSA1/START domain
MSRLFEQDFVFKASIERVWQALTTPAEMEKWLGSKVLAFEPRVGGKVHIEGLHAGELTAFEPPRTFTWSWDPVDGTEPVIETLTLHEEEGGVRIHLHSVLTGRWADDPMFRGGNIGGWLNWMEDLAAWVERGEEASTEPYGLLGAGLGAESNGESDRIFVKSVKAGGPAEAAGLQVGDVLRSWNGQALQQVSTLYRIMWRCPAGTMVRLEVERAGAPLVAELVLAARG